jgi:hypothetical protein
LPLALLALASEHRCGDKQLPGWSPDGFTVFIFARPEISFAASDF